MDQNRLQETTSILLDALKVLEMRFGSATNLVLPLLAYEDRRIGTLLILTLLFFFKGFALSICQANTVLLIV